MLISLEPIHESLQLHINLFKLGTDDVSSKDAAKRINDTGNTIQYISGHLVSARYSMAQMTGVEVKNPFNDIFMKAYDTDNDYPSLQKISEAFDLISPKLIAGLNELNEEQIQAKLSQPFPVKHQTILAGLAFLADHEAYHIGQVGYIRILLGYPSIYDKMFAG